MKYITIFLVLLCCFMGAASAAEDISTDVADASIDDVVITDEAVDADLQEDDSISAEPADADSEADQSDVSMETNDEEGNTRASGTATASDWTTLRNKAQETGTDYTITLTDNIGIGSTDIIFGNNAIIDGNGKIITGNIGTTRIPFKTNTSSYSITFRNIKFQNINCQMIIQLQTNGISKIENCTFINITTGNDHHSVIYNYWGTMNITGCNFTNCTTGYGVITNHNPMSKTGVILNVKDSKFENNYALHEPGAINNCGIATIYNCTFNKNNSTMWAGAIHTHSKADTLIVNSSFTDNIAGYNTNLAWGGGALFTYSKLVVINSTFSGNNCTAASGGGAIGGYSYGSTYNITIDSCNFTNNANNATNGYGGAIGVQNQGYLTVRNSTFINNHATNGQAISGICANVVYCLNCTNCSCVNCTNCTHNVSTGNPYCIINNNTFINHTGDGDTVYISGKNYEFSQNNFINSTQEKEYDDGDKSGLDDYLSPSPSQSVLKSVLGSSILGDKQNHDIIYVNISSENDRKVVDGQSWENAYGGDRALNWAIQHINNDGIIYVADGVYERFGVNADASYTIIGMSRENTIFDTVNFSSQPTDGFPMNFDPANSFLVTFVNITFKNPNVKLDGSKNFINCTFINANILADPTTYESFIIGDPAQYTIYWKDSTFDFNFTDCDFLNYETAGSVLEAFATSQINFNNCKFENVTANSIVNNTGGFIVDDSINFKDCTFNNVNVKGIVDVPTGATFGELYTIEGCTGVESYGIVTADGRDFVNSTKVAVDSVLSGVVNGDSAVITLKDVDGNNIAGAVVSYSINGAEAVNATTDENGQITIPGLSGKGSIAVSYEGNDSFKANTTTIEFNIPVSTKITAPKVSATYNVAKNLVITLTDKDGKALANKKVTVKVGTISKTLTTNAKGQVSLNVATLVPKTYTATVKFAGDDGYLASSVSPKVVVSKAKPKFTAKAKTFKVKVKTKKYTVTLKNNKGKVLKKVKLTLRVGKKTYKATTNSKGKATFKITKLTKKGKYTATVKFAGSKYYKAISKKVKITVKK